MRVICAWCQNEGRSGLLRVREPLDDTNETHGICERHQQAVFEAFPSHSFPSTRWLFIVPASDPARYEHLSNLLRDVPGATVILDRRRGERRRGGERMAPERRRFERRVRRPQVSSLGYALVKFTQRQAEARAGAPAPAGAATAPSGSGIPVAAAPAITATPIASPRVPGDAETSGSNGGSL